MPRKPFTLIIVALLLVGYGLLTLPLLPSACAAGPGLNTSRFWFVMRASARPESAEALITDNFYTFIKGKHNELGGHPPSPPPTATPWPTPAVTGLWGQVDFPFDNDDGVKITDVEVKVTSARGKRYSVNVHEDTTYAIRGLPSGDYTVELFPPNFVVSYEPPYAVAGTLSETVKLAKGQSLRLDLAYMVEERREAPPTPTPTPTPLPLTQSGIDPLLFVLPSLQVRDLMEMDTDDDGELEVILINGRSDATGVQVMLLDPQIEATSTYYLIGDAKGVFSKVERIEDIALLDIEGDGIHEVAVKGATGEELAFFFVFRWNGSDYDFLEGLRGEGRFFVEDIDDDGVAEMFFREPIDALEGTYSLVSVYEWVNDNYEYIEEKYRCLTFAEDVVELYYEAIVAGDYEEAFSYLGKEARRGRTYEEFAAGFVNTVEVKVLEKEVISSEIDNWVERVTIEATDQEDDQLVTRHFAITWTVGLEGGCPKLLEAEVKTLE